MNSVIENFTGNNRCSSNYRIFCRTSAHLLKKRISLFISGIIAIVHITACGPPSLDAKSMQALFEDRKQPVFDNYAVDDRLIHYAEVQSPGNLLIVFLHGTPGSWHNWARYMADENLSVKTHLIAVDRPGFGKSAAKGVVPSLQKQAEYLRPIFERNTSGQGILLVGHSLGATIAVRMAMEYPEQLCGLVLVAASLDPALEKPRWYNILAASPLIRWMIPSKMQLANEEVMVLEEELTKMLPLWHTINIPITIIQGGKDGLVLPANADFAERMLKNKKPKIIRVTDAGHFILWENPDIIRNAIFGVLDQNCQTNEVN
ncbi:MAG: alpha/beta fold hydrolase [Planctomycetota bacterium]|jgi:pimeloyl-ACP methyl ester carboxylesterase